MSGETIWGWASMTDMPIHARFRRRTNHGSSAMNRGSSNRTVSKTRRHVFSDTFAVKPSVLEVLDLLRQLAPVPHQFQISISGFRVFYFLRCGVAFQRLDPEPFRSRRHQDQRGAIRPVPSIYQAAPYLNWRPSRVPTGRHRETNLFPRDDLALAAMNYRRALRPARLPAQ
jgi:hypothetical protein